MRARVIPGRMRLPTVVFLLAAPLAMVRVFVLARLPVAAQWTQLAGAQLERRGIGLALGTAHPHVPGVDSVEVGHDALGP